VYSTGFFAVVSESTSRQQQDLFERDAPPWEADAVADALAAGVVFADAPYGPFHYVVPPSLVSKVEVGMRLMVPLGKQNRPIIGWCTELLRGKYATHTMKEVIEAVDEFPLAGGALVPLVQWISDYYLAPAGQVFETLIPRGVRASAGTREQTTLRPTKNALDDATIDALPPKQRSVMRHLIAAARPMTPNELASMAGCTTDPIQRLRKAGLIEAKVQRVLHGAEPLPQSGSERSVPPPLSPAQTHAVQRIVAHRTDGDRRPTLLFGVTGSGKTEVYMQAIAQVLRDGKQAIILVPEISLTPQTRQRFADRFGSVVVLHSQLSPVQRHHHWLRIASGQVPLVIGPRSAIFAPLPRLGLIVIDEEHDASFKQDTIPRYHARDVAIERARLEGAVLVLGSATPSLESWTAANKGAMDLIRLPNRVGDRPLPEVRLIDLRLRENRSRGSISRPLQQAIAAALADRGQVMLLLNRRGFASTIQCPACGHVVACPDCDLPLTHHHDGSKATCHYCNYTIATPPVCPQCKFDGVRYSGVGTQRLEHEVKARFESATVARMDSDTMKRPGSHERTLAAFRAGEIDVLLGTQMIAKGLDFPNVTLVGVINADTALHFPDLRAGERTFQLVTQVAGRTGRGERGGRVLVQTFSPEHDAIQAASRHDFEAFAAKELANRGRFGYPPLGRLARVIVRGVEEDRTAAYAERFGKQLAQARANVQPTVRILGPAPPPIARLRGKYRFHLLLQSDDQAALAQVLRIACREMKATEDLQWVVDIDPLDMM
jgi:primosomal protein N' (replication factor Y) (superfamily II helicase)